MKKLILLFCFATGIYSLANAQQTPPTPPQPPQDSTLLQQYVGKYKFPDGSVVADVTVAIENGAMTMTSSAGVSPLEKQAEDLYAITQFQGTAKFNRDANKKVIGVSINAQGYLLEGTKTENIASVYQIINKNSASRQVVSIGNR